MIQQRFPGKCQSFTAFDSAKRCIHEMHKGLTDKVPLYLIDNTTRGPSLWDAYKAYCQQHMNWVGDGANLNHVTIYHINYKVMKKFGDVREWRPAVFLMLKNALPTTDDVPYLIKTVADADKLSLLTTPMQESKGVQVE